MASAQPIPQYYDILHITPKATTEEVRTAYKKESLKTHPDRKPNATPAEKKVLTAKFQAVADAYYVLSNDQRRREYDILLRSRGRSSYTSYNPPPSTSSSSGPSAGGAAPGGGPFPFFSTDPSASSAFFEQFKSFFANPPQSSSKAKEAESSDDDDPPAPTAGASWNDGARPDADEVFGDVFEELLRPEVQRRVNWWTYVGALSGASLGFILANIPGALAGGFAGNRLGAIRDAKGKPVVTVFAQLATSQKAEILKILALKVFGSLTSI